MLKIKQFTDKFNFSGRLPTEYKTEFSLLKQLKELIDTNLKMPKHLINEFVYSSIAKTIKYLFISKPDKIEFALNYLLNRDGDIILKLKNATYHNKSIMTDSNFKLKANTIDKFLSTLKDFHKQALTVKELNIYFVKKEDLSVSANYKVNMNIMQIRPDKINLTDNKYGSLNYIVIHELGHRYEKFFTLKTNFDKPEWQTTGYSKKEGLSYSESFAELFALSFFNYTDNIFKDFKEKLDKFKKMF